MAVVAGGGGSRVHSEDRERGEGVAEVSRVRVRRERRGVPTGQDQKEWVREHVTAWVEQRQVQGRM